MKTGTSRKNLFCNISRTKRTVTRLSFAGTRREGAKTKVLMQGAFKAPKVIIWQKPTNHFLRRVLGGIPTWNSGAIAPFRRPPPRQVDNIEQIDINLIHSTTASSCSRKDPVGVHIGRLFWLQHNQLCPERGAWGHQGLPGWHL